MAVKHNNNFFEIVAKNLSVKNTMCLKKFLFIGLVLILTSCHSEYVTLKRKTCRNPTWNSNKTIVAFVALNTASRRPTGIARFPDGGRSKFEYSELSLYLYKLKDKQLVKEIQFNDLIDKIYGPFRDNYSVKMAFKDSLVYYYIKPINWHNLDSLIKVKYNKTYSFNINTTNISEVDTSLFFSVYRETKETNKIGITELDKILSGITLTEWGLVIQDVYPQSDKEYMEYIIYKGGNIMSQQAIMEQIIPNLEKKKIKYIGLKDPI